ncbi:hypothetical protein OIU84_015477 [Salix udensis]|uniref:Uncharacterized protein n=1 Tax=Salix udensis TaxID=889485 RepID=A0AAD6JEJ0_9ROSI|nr:hypothetical protein OIU84_015477 [Salix udensis]
MMTRSTITMTSGEIDCDRPNYSSYSEPSAYADEALETEYNSYARPKPPPGSTYGGPQPAYGFQPGMNRPGSEYGSDGYVKPASEEYGRIPESDYGPDGNGKPQGEEYGSGYGRRPESEYESGDHERPSEYGSGYGRRQESEYGSMYERPQSEEYGSGYGRRVVGKREKAMGEGADMISQCIEMIQLRGLVMGDRREEESLGGLLMEVVVVMMTTRIVVVSIVMVAKRAMAARNM